MKNVSFTYRIDMAAPAQAKGRMFTKIVESQTYRIRQDVSKWRMALQAAEDPLNPDREPLYTLYEDLVIDNHLESIIKTRILNVLCKKFMIASSSTGKEDKEKTKLLKKQWFRDFLTHAMESIFYGHSLIEFGFIVNNHFDKVELLPRIHVEPRKGEVKLQKTDIAGLPFREGINAKWMIEVGKPKNLGLLMKAGPTVLWKKASMTAWPEFCEIFGMPLRKATDQTADPDRRKALEMMLKKMGQAAYVVLEDGQDVEFVENTRGDAYQVFDKHIERMNQELSKLILGQTGTTDEKSFVGSAEVHERVSDKYTLDDCEMITTLINERVLPFLRMHGYPFLETDEFKFDEAELLKLLDQWTIVQGLLQNGFDVEENWVTDTFGVPVTKKPEPEVVPGVPGSKPLPGKTPAKGPAKKPRA